MAIHFPGNEYLMLSFVPYTAVEPITMACWFKPASVALNMTLMCIGYETTSIRNDIMTIGANGTLAGDPLRIYVHDGTSSASAGTTSGFVLNEWQHACGVFNSLSERSIYLNGGSKGTDTTGLANTPHSGRFCMAAASTGPNTWNEYSGDLAELTFWNEALSDEEIAALAAGVPANWIRPHAIFGYWPGWRRPPVVPDYSGNGYGLNPHFYNCTTVNHAPVGRYVPRARGLAAVLAGGAPPATGIPRHMMHYARQRRAA